jgi:hypothetical protein
MSPALAAAGVSSVPASGNLAKKSERQLAQRTIRPSGPILSSSMLYLLAQVGQTMSMANQCDNPARSRKGLSSVGRVHG